MFPLWLQASLVVDIELEEVSSISVKIFIHISMQYKSLNHCHVFQRHEILVLKRLWTLRNSFTLSLHAHHVPIKKIHASWSEEESAFYLLKTVFTETRCNLFTIYHLSMKTTYDSSHKNGWIYVYDRERPFTESVTECLLFHKQLDILIKVQLLASRWDIHSVVKTDTRY